MKEFVDLRSDTVTRPGEDMLNAMMHARVGDDVFGEDKTTNELQEFAADLFGMEAALFCPSGTMTNQIAIKLHTRPGDEVICEAQSHVYIYEGGGIAFNSGCQARPIHGDRGRIDADQVAEAINPDDVHRAVSRLVSLENTCNRGGGSCYDLADIRDIRHVCDSNDLKLHLDGARLFNALIARNQSPKDYGNLFDSISICLSKGLGAPVGSLLLGDRDFIKRGRRIRKVFGGGMRQCGYLAAAGLYALQHNVTRLEEDHNHAKQIATTLENKSFVGGIQPVETNILIFEVQEPYTARSLSEALAKEGILVIPISKTSIRMVLHLDVSPAMVAQTIRAIEKL